MTKHQLLLSAHRRFNHLLSVLALSADIQPFLATVISSVEEFLPGCKVSILTLNRETNTLHSGANNNLPDFYNDAIEGVEIGENIGSCGAAAYLNKAIIVEDINTHPNWQPFLELTKKANLHACWSVPFCDSHSNVMGTFAIYHHQPKSPTEIEREIVNVASLITSVAMEKRELEEKLRFSATHDELTELFNRTYLNSVGDSFISLCLRNNLNCSILFIDLNKFKRVNDMFGHKKGDSLLSQIAKIIQKQTRSSDIAARFGGDEFIIIMENSNDRDGKTVAKRIQKSILESISDEILALDFGVSIGVAMLNNQQQTLNQLINAADQAMYTAKRNNLGVYCK
ncbi:sensor domain-containing diguanylate cyclase [Pseudoalteromonas sp. G4]|uniref:sensor domain-containing diguanylate cyclase n=1 Tax=Pseudoalteromonas sp. G4 TaxID=2992761 RepID=UPI00237D696D|nr:sensor domain-containing diguanylate cyclase [Pseudoalteromonas sp. G4]MDE3271830.1 sensor domain-containing diguanylate cyclase [Pseudoalteromonas sp. G4]